MTARGAHRISHTRTPCSAGMGVMGNMRVKHVQLCMVPAPDWPERAAGVDEVCLRYLRRRLSEENLTVQQMCSVLEHLWEAR